MQNIIWMLVLVLRVKTNSGTRNSSKLGVFGDITFNITANVAQPLPNNCTTVETDLEDTKSHLTNITEQTSAKATTRLPPMLLTLEQAELATRIVSYLNYPIQALGVIFCTFSVIVYSRKEMQSSSSTMILAFNCGELTTLLFNILIDMLVAVLGPVRLQNIFFLAIVIYVEAYIGTCITRSTFFYVLFLTLSRFLAVAFPLKFRQLRMFKHPTVLIIPILVITLASHFYVAIRYEFYPKTSPTTNETVWGFRLTGYYLKNREWMDRWSFGCTILFVCFPLISSFFINIGTVVALQRHKQRRKNIRNNQLSETDSKERQLTRTILTSSFFFLFLVLPINVSALVSTFDADFMIGGGKEYLYSLALRIGNTCEMATTCIDFICYITLSSQFRKTFKELFKNCKSGQCVKRQKNPAGTETVT